jgi:hypothetical protein
VRLGLVALVLVGCSGAMPEPCSALAAETLQAMCLEAIERADTAEDARRIVLACELLHESRCP